MKQAELFTARVEYAGTGWVHCNARAILGPEIDHGGCVNREIRCASCGAKIGVLSNRKDLAGRAARSRNDGTR